MVWILVIVIAVVVILLAKEKNKPEEDIPAKKEAEVVATAAAWNQFLATHPKEKKIVEQLEEDDKDTFVRDLVRKDKLYVAFKNGAIAVLEFNEISYNTGYVVLTPNMAYFYSDRHKMRLPILRPNLHKFCEMLSLSPVMNQVTRTKQVSVVGSAVAGAVIAGGAGAVVGAVSAANQNASGGRTVQGPFYDSGERELCFSYKAVKEASTTLYTAKDNKIPLIRGPREVYGLGEDYNKQHLDEMIGSAANKCEAFLEYLKNVCNEFDSQGAN